MVKPTAFYQKSWLSFGLLALLVIVLRWPSLAEVIDNDSGAIAYHARLMLNGESLYGSHFPGHHMPAAYYLYYLSFKLFGDVAWAPKALLIPWSIGTAFLVFFIGKKFIADKTGFLAAVFYVVVSSSPRIKGTTAEIELFANLFRVGAVYLTFHTLKQGKKAYYFLSVGLLASISFWLKAVYLSPFLIAGVAILLLPFANYQANSNLKCILLNALTQLGWLLMGLLIGIGLLLIPIYLSRTLDGFQLLFQAGKSYVGLFSPFLILYRPFVVLSATNYGLLLIGLGGCVANIYFFVKRDSSITMDYFYPMMITFWLLLSWLEAGIGPLLVEHYSLLILPPLALLSASAVFMIGDLLRKRWPKSRWEPLLILVVIEISLLVGWGYYSHYVLYRLNLVSYESFLEQIPRSGNDLVSVRKVVVYIQANTQKDDFIFCWCDAAQVYYLANRRSPIAVIWPQYAIALQPYEEIFIPETKYFIKGKNSILVEPEWVNQQLQMYYFPEIQIDGYTFYRRLPNH